MAHAGVLVMAFAVLLVAAAGNPLPVSYPDASAKPSSYSQKTETVCLRDSAFRQCGWVPLALIFPETIDFSCCEEHDYNGNDGSSFLRTLSPAAATCNTEISIDIVPILEYFFTPMQFGKYVKVGKAVTDCTFNGNADDCHGPLCDNMRTSGQGDIYIVPSKASVQRYFPNFQDTCSPLNGILGTRVFRLKTGDAARDAKRGLSSYSDLQSLFEEIWYLITGGVSPEAQTKPVAGKDGAKAAISSYYSHGYNEGIVTVSAPETLVDGLSIVVSGTMRVVGGPDKIEEVGQFEYTPAFVALDDPLISGDKNQILAAFNFANAPKVHPGKAQLQFYKEESY